MNDVTRPLLTRRAALALLSTGTVLPACTATSARMPQTSAAGASNAFATERLQEDLETYDGFGIHRSGSRADGLTTDWMAAHLSRHGYDVRQQAFRVPNHDTMNAQIQIEGTGIELAAQPPFRPAGAHIVSGELVYAGPAGLQSDPGGKIILADAPYGRPSSFESREYRALANLALEQNAKALLLITNGPTGDAALLNISLHRNYPLTALVAPDIADQLRPHALRGRSARLVTPPSKPARTAQNVIAALTRGPRAIVVSTPTSGWTHCAGERGPGIAALRALASWLPKAFTTHTIILLAASGHELGHLGGETFLEDGAPPPGLVDLWVHLGAGWATRDWHETPSGLLPLEHADPQRYLLASPSVSAPVATAFKGISGLGQVYPLTSETAAGELKTIHQAGYRNLFGMFAAHRYHHTMADRMNCTSGSLLRPPLNALREAIKASIRT